MSEEFTKKFMENIGSAGMVFYSYPEDVRDTLLNAEIKAMFPKPDMANITKQDIADIATLRVLKRIITEQKVLPMTNGIAKEQENIYNKVYTEVAGYGVKCHSVNMIDTITPLLIENKCHSVLDAGCGRGQLIPILLDKGFDVTGVDISDVQIGDDVPHERFIKHALWDLPCCTKYDAVVCTDVLEHIPIEALDKTLEEISRVTEKIAIFKICLVKEGHGRFVGEDLHPTILPAAEWLKCLGLYYDDVTILDNNISNAVFYCRR